MSNRSARMKASLRRPHRKITAEDRLRTLDLYMALGNSNLVAAELGISGSAARDRLYAMGVELLPHGRCRDGERQPTPWTVNDPSRIARIRAELHAEGAKAACS